MYSFALERCRSLIALIVAAQRGASPENMFPAGAVHGKQPAAVGAPPLELGRVLAVVGDHRAPGVLLVPAEGRHVVVAAEQQARLAGPRLGREVALPRDDAVTACSSHRAIVGACPSLSARRSTGSARPSISNRITPGTSVRFASWLGGPAGERCGAGARRRRGSGRGEEQQGEGENEGGGDRVQEGGASPSTNATATETTTAFRTREPRPKVNTASGSNTRITSGHRAR